MGLWISLWQDENANAPLEATEERVGWFGAYSAPCSAMVPFRVDEAFQQACHSVSLRKMLHQRKAADAICGLELYVVLLRAKVAEGRCGRDVVDALNYATQFEGWARQYPQGIFKVM